MSRYREWALDCKIYVGNLGPNAVKQDIEDAFNKYGPMKNVWVARNPSGFAFVEFEEPRDAEDAVRAMDGRRLCGSRIKVEMSHGRSRRGGGGGGRRPPPPPFRRYNSYDDRRYNSYDDRQYRSRYDDTRSRTPPMKRRYSRSRSRSPGSMGQSPRRQRSISRSASPPRERR